MELLDYFKECTTCKVKYSIVNFHRKYSRYRDSCKACRKKETQEYYQKNKGAILQKTTAYAIKNKAFLASYKKDYRKKNYCPKKRKEQYIKYRDIINKRNLERYRTDSLYKLKRCMQRRIYMKLKGTKTERTDSYLGCNIRFLKSYIEKLFTTGMSWDNYGKWHIDHIRPLCSANTEKNLLALFHYSNLQPLWALDNMRKNGKYEMKDISIVVIN